MNPHPSSPKILTMKNSVISGPSLLLSSSIFHIHAFFEIGTMYVPEPHVEYKPLGFLIYFLLR